MSTNPLNSRAPSSWVLWNGSLSKKTIQVKKCNKCNNETLKLLHEIRNTDKKKNSKNMFHKHRHQAVHRNQNTSNRRHRLREATRAHRQYTRPEYNNHNNLTQHRPAYIVTCKLRSMKWIAQRPKRA